jgi:hypothetical protein
MPSGRTSGDHEAGCLVDRTISDLESFDQHTRGDQALAGLYAFLKLDVLVQAAHKVSVDFFARPEIYRDPDIAAVAPELAALYARYGRHEEYLSGEQRHGIFSSLFEDEAEGDAPAAFAEPLPAENGASASGCELRLASNGTSHASNHYARERDQLLAATAAFAERVFDTGERPLRDTVGVMIPGLRSYLRDLDHAMVQWAREVGLRKLTEKTSYKILRNRGIARAFGLQAPSTAWPYVEEANGTTLVAEISNRLGGHITRQEFIDRQRLALRGAEAVATVLDVSDGNDVAGADLNLVISKCYTWYAARGRALGLPLATIAVAPNGSSTDANGGNGNRNRTLFAPAHPVGS